MAAPPPLIVPAPPAGGWRGHPLFSLENLYRAYRRCRRRKRRTHNALAFKRRLEDNLDHGHARVSRLASRQPA